MAKTLAAHRSWFRIALGVGDDTRLVAASGDHLGAAIAAAEAHVPGAITLAVEPAAEAEIPLGEAVGKQTVVDLGSATPPSRFAWPIGVVPQLGTELADATRGYHIPEHSDPFVIEAQVERDKVGEVFFQLVERLPAADNLEIKLLDHFEGGTTDVWLTSRVNGKKVIAFLDDHDLELFGNGHVEVSVYVRAKQATLRLTEHRTIAWIADERDMEADVVGWLRELAIPHVPDLVTASSVPHFHYRPGKSLARGKLAELLYRERLRRVAVVRPNAPVAPPPRRAPDTAG